MRHLKTNKEEGCQQWCLRLPLPPLPLILQCMTPDRRTLTFDSQELNHSSPIWERASDFALISIRPDCIAKPRICLPWWKLPTPAEEDTSPGLRFHGSPSIFDWRDSMRINFKSILKTFVLDFRDNGFPIDGKSILIDGNPWELNPGIHLEDWKSGTAYYSLQ